MAITVSCNSITINSCTVTGSGERVSGNGTLITQKLPVTSFRQIRLNAPVNVEYIQSSKSRLEICIDSNLLEFVRVESDGRTLAISTTGSFITNKPISVKCSSPRIENIYLQGSGDIEISSLQTPSLCIYLQGSGDISIDDGFCEELSVTLQGSGDIDASDFIANSAWVSLQGSGDIRVHCLNSVSAKLAGSGGIKIYGKPSRQHISEEGSGRIKLK